MTKYEDGPLLSKEDQEILGELDPKNVSKEVLKHAAHPHNLGLLKDPDGQAIRKGICGDAVLIQLRLQGEIVDDIRFQSSGCGFTLACGSVATELARGKSVRYALGVTGKEINRTLGSLPLEHTHCADLAANTLKAAVQDALNL